MIAQIIIEVIPSGNREKVDFQVKNLSKKRAIEILKMVTEQIENHPQRSKLS